MSYLPDTVSLRQHLDARTVPELTEFLRFWAPHEKGRNGRADLVDKLMRVMSDENVVYAKVDLLSERVRDVLLGLLRKTHFSCDLQGLFRGVEGLDMEHYEAEAALTALSKRGFVLVNRDNEAAQYERGPYSIPVEMALVMRGLAGVDSRALDQVFSRGGFKPSSVEAAGNKPPGEIPESVTDAIADLPNKVLRTIAHDAFEHFGGLITRREFAEVFASRRIGWRTGQFLREFGRRGLGTVGHLDLRSKGIGVDDDVLMLFSESVERYVDEWRAREVEHDLVLTAHGDLMSDVRNTLEQTTAFAVRVAKEGAVYKASRARIAEQLQFCRQPLLDPLDIADRALSIARTLNLVETGAEGQLAVTEAGERWLRRPLLDKIRDAYALLFVGGKTLRTKHLSNVQRILVELLTGSEGWWPGRSLAMVARNRYLLELASDDAPPNRMPLTVLPAALTELGGAAHGLLIHDFFCLGLVDVALLGEEPVAVRLSRLGQRVLGEDTAGDNGEAKALIVNPDFELLVLPEGDVDDLLHELDRYAERTRTGEVVHYKLDRARIERATVGGETSEAVLSLLESNARSPLPQNVVYSIRSWANDVRSATLQRGVLFQASDAGVVESILNHAGLKEHVQAVVDGHTIFFSPDVSETQLAQELHALGVYVK